MAPLFDHDLLMHLGLLLTHFWYQFSIPWSHVSWFLKNVGTSQASFWRSAARFCQYLAKSWLPPNCQHPKTVAPTLQWPQWRQKIKKTTTLWSTYAPARETLNHEETLSGLDLRSADVLRSFAFSSFSGTVVNKNTWCFKFVFPRPLADEKAAELQENLILLKIRQTWSNSVSDHK